LTTGKWARNDDDEAAVPGNPPAKRLREVELPELRFTAFSGSYCGPDSTRTHSTTYVGVNEFPRLVRWARGRAPQLSTKSMLLKTNITLRNDDYMDFFPGVEKGERGELGISDQGSWNAALMMAQANCPNEGTFAGLLVVAIDAESDENHGVEEEIRPDYTSEEEDEPEPWRINRPENPGPGGEGPSQPSTQPRPSRKGKERAIDTGDNDGDGDSDQDGNDHDYGDNDDGDDDDGDDDDYGDGGNDDLYSRPGK